MNETLSTALLAKGFRFLASGSNKDIYEIESEPGLLAFVMSDRVSVFDVGALPDRISGRAGAMERFALAIAREFQRCGIDQAWDSEATSRFGAFVQARAQQAKFQSLDPRSLLNQATSSDAVLPLVAEAQSFLLQDSFSGSGQAKTPPLEFVPLEVIVRWGVPLGSSLVKKDPQKYLTGMRFKNALVDFTTKLESQDRALSREEAQSLCPEGLRLSALEESVLKAAEVLRNFLSVRGLELWDAKFEFAWDRVSHKAILVDAVSPDELRLTLKGWETVPLSKELLRLWLRQTDWYESVLQAKTQNTETWREALPVSPRLGPYRSGFLSRLYEILAEIVEGPEGPLHTRSLVSLLQSQDPRVPKPKVCVIGEGGRELALKWRLEHEGVEIVDQPDQSDACFVGRDADLAEGLADKLRAEGHWVVGPSSQAARLEWSKSFGRKIAHEAGVSIPYYSLSQNLEDFESGLPDSASSTLPVIKLDGLAAGKGVFLPETREHAQEIIENLKAKKIPFLLEERCAGEEASVFFAIGRDAWGRQQARLLGTAKDFKRRFLGDEGPNTGGMGAWVPHPNLTQQDLALFGSWAEASVSLMLARAEPFRGILYLGVMRDAKKSWVLIEYNARLGDPETQALVLSWPQDQAIMRELLQLTPFVSEFATAQTSHSSLCLALVHPNYPDPAEPLELSPWDLPARSELKVFLTPSRSGRVAYLVARGRTRLEAGDQIFETLLDCPWKHSLEWRTDILR